VEIKLEIEIRFKLGVTYAMGDLAGYGDNIHLTKLRDVFAAME